MADKPAPEEKKVPAAKAAEAKAPGPAGPKPAAVAKPAAPVAAARPAEPSGDDVPAEDREALRAQWADEAQRATAEHDKKVRRFLLRLSLANWGIAIIAWTVSASLGIKSPASIIVYSVLFVIGLVAAILAILTYLLEKFGHEPQPLGAISGDEDDGEDGAVAAAKGDTAAPAAT